MKTLRILIMLVCLGVAAAAHAQTTPVPAQQTPTTTPETTTEGDKKPEFNAPQTPVRPAQVPSEDTLIKAQKNSAVIQDRMMPSTDKKSDRANRRKNKRGTTESDDANAVKTLADSTRKP
ncbi:hypothetical protein [Dyadobacter luticola]|uniref:Uncharacterized protein n=1 Tax=Dyadobacter luticola TaxID=1979387 RepID=A0A5R9KPL5_9BACT|nr:hypothetical protein [Dyadobacter luticola]TLU98130.1 hypothetical protein FEN17_25465 [Dyadobacter luticola]